MSSVSLLLKRKITGAPRAVLRRIRKLGLALLARLWKIAWATVLFPIYALAVFAQTRLARRGLAEQLLQWMSRLPVYLEFQARRLMKVQQERGKITEPAAIALRICRLNPTSSTVRLANEMWSAYAQTEPGWQAVASAPRPSTVSRHAAVITPQGEDLFGDLLEQMQYDFTSHAVQIPDERPLIAECSLDRVATHIAAHFIKAAPDVVIAAPASLTDYHSVAVADAVARWAQAPLIVRLPLTSDRPAETEIAHRSHAKFSELLKSGLVVTADSQLLREISAIDEARK